jgi:hypothetical protein
LPELTSSAMLLFLAAAFTPQPAQPASVAATAAVRIERPVTVSSKEWEDVPERGRSERAIRDEQGRKLLLRLIEMQ